MLTFIGVYNALLRGIQADLCICMFLLQIRTVARSSFHDTSTRELYQCRNLVLQFKLKII
jgi:hypothetical protein